MYNHAPERYVCKFCCLIQGIACEGNQLERSDIIVRNDVVTAFMATRRWPNNQGHVLIIPNHHFENIYDLPIAFATEIHQVARRVALAMKTIYGCDGILMQQQNEPAGGQHIWHYHLHVIPRYENDGFHASQKEPFPAWERAELAQKLRKSLEL